MEDQKINLIQIVFGTASIILLLASFIICLIYFHKNRQFMLQLEMDEMKSNFEKNILATRLEIQEQTFQQISREIHDSISLSLTLSKLHLATLNYPKPIFRHEKIDASICLIGEAIQKLNNISKSLNSDLIRESGLLSAIENEISAIKQIGLYKVNFTISGRPVYLDSERDLLIFRIIQESLNNILKHAKASTIELLFKYDQCNLEVLIKDNGIGIDMKERGKGSGLISMRQRASVLRGNFELISEPNNGTTVKLKIPLL